jgi:hypothetical protein
MNLDAIRRESRFRLKDEAKQGKFWSDEWLDGVINEAEQEACIRARLIEDSSSEASSLEITTDEMRYALHPSVIDVLSCELESNAGHPIAGWTLTETELVFDDFPEADDTLLMTVIRLPLKSMVKNSDCPEIRPHHHIKLVDWVEFRAYGIHDADGFDPQGSAKGYDRFEASFGPRPTANVQRKQRRKTARVVRMNPF